MDFAYSDKVMALQAKLTRFMDEHITPNERRWHEEIGENARASRLARRGQSTQDLSGRTGLGRRFPSVATKVSVASVTFTVSISSGLRCA